MDKLTIDRIETAHPIIREELKKLYIECNNKLPKGVRLRFSSVYRSPIEQNALYHQKPKVTNSKAYQSIHQYGLAFDYVILLDKDGNGTFESIEWDIKSPYHIEVVAFFKAKGYEWGGDWKRFKDYPHFQKVYSLTWQQLKQRLNLGMTISSNNIVYPKI